MGKQYPDSNTPILSCGDLAKGGKINDATVVPKGQASDFVAVDKSKVNSSGYVDSDKIIKCIVNGEKSGVIMEKYNVDEQFLSELCSKHIKDLRRNRNSLAFEVEDIDGDYKAICEFVDEVLGDLASFNEGLYETNRNVARALKNVEERERAAEEEIEKIFQHLAEVEKRRNKLNDTNRELSLISSSIAENLEKNRERSNTIKSFKEEGFMQKRDAEKRKQKVDRDLEAFEKCLSACVNVFKPDEPNAIIADKGSLIEQDATVAAPLTIIHPLAETTSSVRRTPRKLKPVKRLTYK